jgi:hypothetical protein
VIMSLSKPVPLRRLLRQREAQTLLGALAALRPGCDFALMAEDHSLIATTDNFPEAPLHAVARDVDLGMNGPLNVGGFRLYPLGENGRAVGALVIAHSQGEDGHGGDEAPVLLLRTLVARTLEARDVADDALDRYRELNLLYRLGDTLGDVLDTDLIPQIVLEEARQMITADVGGVMLSITAEQAGEIFKFKASFGSDGDIASLQVSLFDILSTIGNTDQSTIISGSALKMGLGDAFSAILWVPLKTAKPGIGWDSAGAHGG